MARPDYQAAMMPMLILALFITDIFPSTSGFILPPRHARASAPYDLRSPVLLRADLTDDHITTEVTLQSLRETLRRLRLDLRTAVTIKKHREPSADNDDDDDDEGTTATSRGAPTPNRDLSPDEMARETLLCTRIPKLALCHTVVGPSKIPGAGRGLFALHDISKGDLITCYPGDALIYTPPYAGDDGDDDEGEDIDEIVIWGEHVDEAERWDEDAVFDGHWSVEGSDDEVGKDGRPLTDYALEVCESYAVLGMPLLDVDPAYSGHYANDGAGRLAMDGAVIGDGVSVEEGIVAFVNESLRLANAQNRVVEDSHMGTIATKNISEGDEILVTYGMDYWMEHSNF
mmetsp:Transcript_35344/g.42193  ORF Transcript_35344/g.42193 Transcript_35344/m.42193 type:complete len:344 (+) Transcript_35344:71-1102(+)